MENEKRKKYTKEMKIMDYDADQLTNLKSLSELFELDDDVKILSFGFSDVSNSDLVYCYITGIVDVNQYDREIVLKVSFLDDAEPITAKDLKRACESLCKNGVTKDNEKVRFLIQYYFPDARGGEANVFTGQNSQFFNFYYKDLKWLCL